MSIILLAVFLLGGGFAGWETRRAVERKRGPKIVHVERLEIIGCPKEIRP